MSTKDTVRMLITGLVLVYLYSGCTTVAQKPTATGFSLRTHLGPGPQMAPHGGFGQ